MTDVLDIDNAEDFEVDDDGDRKCEIINKCNSPNLIFIWRPKTKTILKS